MSPTIKNLLLLALAGLTIALPLDNDKRDPKKDIGIGITFKYPFKAAEGATQGEVEKRGKDAITFTYPIFKVAEGTGGETVEKRDKDSITFKYPIFKAEEGTVEKRNKDAIEFSYPIFKAAEGAVEKREPKGPYADAISAADPRDILG